MKIKKIAVATALATALMGVGGMAQATSVGLELALLVDVSTSVDSSEYNLQKTGYVDAFNNATIQGLIAGTPGGVAVTYIEWSSFNRQSIRVEWTLLTDGASSSAFANAILHQPRAFFGGTAPGSALNFVAPLFSNNGYEGSRWTIDVSGDGQENGGADTSDARDAFLGMITSGEGLTKTINGLPIGGGTTLSNWYTNNIKSPNGFVIASDSFNDFDAALQHKLGREIQDVPEPASLALLGLGLAGLGFARRRKQS